jgi:hypothetical protein
VSIIFINPYSFAAAAATDPDFASVSLLLHGDGTNGSTTITDNSPSPKTVTAFGNAQISTAQSKFGGASIAFDGTGDYASTGNSSDLLMGSAVFTIECWFYPNAQGVSQIFLTSQAGAQSFANMGFQFVTAANNTVQMLAGGNAQKTVTGSSSNTFTANTWNHVAAVKDLLDSKYYIYLNGVRNAGFSIAASGNILEPFISNPLVTAGGFGTGWNFGSRFNGYIDDVRITKGVARYTANFTPPTAPFPDA